MNEYASSTDGRSTRSTSGLLYAILGAVVMTVFGWIPFAPVVGGAVSGYLEATQPDDSRSASSRGLRVGALAGLLATIPAALVIALIGTVFTAGFFGMGATGGMPAGLSVGFGLFGVVLVVVGLLVLVAYHAGLGALGGWLGAALAADRGDIGASERRTGRGASEDRAIDDRGESTTEAQTVDGDDRR